MFAITTIYIEPVLEGTICSPELQVTVFFSLCQSFSATFKGHEEIFLISRH